MVSLRWSFNTFCLSHYLRKHLDDPAGFMCPEHNTRIHVHESFSTTTKRLMARGDIFYTCYIFQGKKKSFMWINWVKSHGHQPRKPKAYDKISKQLIIGVAQKLRNLNYIE